MPSPTLPARRGLRAALPLGTDRGRFGARSGLRAPLASAATLRALALASAAALAAPPPAAAQDGDSRPPAPPRLPEEGRTAAGPLIASDGEPVAPGRIPSDTDPVARARFEKLARALERGEAIRGFELPFEFVHRTDETTRSAIARIRYLDEGVGWVYGAFLNKDGSVRQSQMRGPRDDGRAGYWQILKDSTVVSLVTDDYEESRDELDGWASLSHDLLVLTQPQRLGIVRLEARKATLRGTDGVGARALDLGAGDVLLLPVADAKLDPALRTTRPLAERAAELEWISLVTPDVRQWREPAGDRSPKRVLLGIDPERGLPELAVLAPRIEGRVLASGLSLVHFAHWVPYGAEDARLLPRSTVLFELRASEGEEVALAPAAFRNRATVDLYLLMGGTLGVAGLTPASFRP